MGECLFLFMAARVKITPGSASKARSAAPCAGVMMRIFDTFMFDGELTLLRYRLAEIYDLVDYFVLVEARRTYSNQPKPLIFTAQQSEFAWAAAKMRVVALDGLGGPRLSARERAAVQRTATLLALREAAPEDVVLLLDADEIPSRNFLMQVRSGAIVMPCLMAMTHKNEKQKTHKPAKTNSKPSVSQAMLTALRRPLPGCWS